MMKSGESLNIYPFSGRFHHVLPFHSAGLCGVVQAAASVTQTLQENPQLP
jgi:hypothetical protein